MARKKRATEVFQGQQYQRNGNNSVTRKRTPKRTRRRDGDGRNGHFVAALATALQLAPVVAAPPPEKTPRVNTRPKRKPNPPPPPLPKPERLETRAWWPAFLAERAERERRRMIEERSRADREAERVWAAIRRGRGAKIVSTDNSSARERAPEIVSTDNSSARERAPEIVSTDNLSARERAPEIVSTDNLKASESLTLRERFLAKAACA